MKPYLKIGLFLLAGISLLLANPTAQLTAIARKKANAGGAPPEGPALSSAVVSSDGRTVTLTWDEAATRGAGYNTGDIDLDGTTTGQAWTYASGDGTTTWVGTMSEGVVSGDTVDIDFNGDANSIEDGSGNDAEAFASSAVTNNSTLLFEWHMEDATLTTADAPIGRVVSGGDVSGTATGTVSISSAQAQDGDESMLANADSSYYSFDMTGLTGIRTAGTCEFYVYVTTWASGTVLVRIQLDANNRIQCILNSTDELRAAWIGNAATVNMNTTESAPGVDMVINTWYKVVFKWRQGSTDPSMFIQVDSLDADTITTDLTDWTGDATEFRIGVQNASGRYHLDNFKLWGSYLP